MPVSPLDVLITGFEQQRAQQQDVPAAPQLPQQPGLPTPLLPNQLGGVPTQAASQSGGQQNQQGPSFLPDLFARPMTQPVVQMPDLPYTGPPGAAPPPPPTIPTGPSPDVAAQASGLLTALLGGGGYSDVLNALGVGQPPPWRQGDGLQAIVGALGGSLLPGISSMPAIQSLFAAPSIVDMANQSMQGWNPRTGPVPWSFSSQYSNPAVAALLPLLGG